MNRETPIQNPGLIVLSWLIFLNGCSENDQQGASNEGTTNEPVIVSSQQDSINEKFDDYLDLTSDTTTTQENKIRRVTDADGDWRAQNIVLANTREAEWMIRTGDIDNLGFGWEDGFTPFSGMSTPPHGFPWEPGKNDASGTDRIMILSGYKNNSAGCGGDGYTATSQRPDNNSRPIILGLTPLKATKIHAASLVLFVDDFQSPVLCSKFQAKLNDKRIIELEKLLNALQQTGPIGKVINIKLPDEFLTLLKADSLSILIDNPETDAADGFAIDFVKLLINPKGLVYKGHAEGMVIDKTTRKQIANASVQIRDYAVTTTDKDGKFSIKNIPAGINIISGSAPGYASSQVQVDVIADDTSKGIIIELSPSEKIVFNNKTMQEGDDLVLNNIQFELASANLTDTGKVELDKVGAFMQKNVKVEILLTGHTSIDGSAEFNKTLSANRVRSCKSYLVSKGIDEGRIEVIGYGADKPIAPNDTEKNRARNRRVEMKITKL